MKTIRRTRLIFLPLACIALAAMLWPRTASANQPNFVYHSATPTDTDCGFQYQSPAAPKSTDTVFIHWQVHNQFTWNQARLYYTTDNSQPSGSFGTPSGTTQVVTGAYNTSCFDNGAGTTVDDVSAAIPAQAKGTIVKYIVSAWCDGASPCNSSGPEIFASSGNITSSSGATVFSYVVTGPNAAEYSHLSVRKHAGSTTLRWYSAERVIGFNVFDGTSRLNRRVVTSRTHWYRFITRHAIRHLRIAAVLPTGH